MRIGNEVFNGNLFTIVNGSFMKRILRSQGSSVTILFFIFSFLKFQLNKVLGLKNETFKEVLNYYYAKGFFSLLNSPVLWDSILGTCIKLLLDIVITSLIIFATIKLLKINYKWGAIFKAVTYAQLVFLVKVILEFYYFKSHPSLLAGNGHQNYSMLSLQSVFNCFRIKIPLHFEYPLQILSAFEIMYWFVIGFLLSKFTNTIFVSNFKIVLLGYVPALFIWLLFISFSILLNS